MTSVEKRRSGRKSGGHRKHSDGGYSDTSSGGSFLDETDREVSNLTDRAFRSLCIGDEAVYNDSDLCSSSPCSQRDRQLAFSQSGQETGREDREREDLKRAAHESFSLRMQQYGQEWIHGGMYGAEIQRDPQWEVYGERTQGRVSATFQHSFVETSQHGESLREEQLSFLSNGATELNSQQRRSRSRVSSLIRAFNSEGHRDGAGMDGKLRDWNDETSWDKSALMSIQRELSEFSTPYQQSFNSGYYPSAGPYSSQEANLYASEVAAVAHMNSASSFMSSSHSKHSMSTQVNCNSNFFIHSEFSPFKVWRDHNRFPFQQGQVSGFMHCSEFPKWYETPMYKELSLEAQPQGPYRFEERANRHPRNNLAPVVPPTPLRSTSTSTLLQKALAVEKRCESELAGHYPHRKRTQSLGTNRLQSQRPSTASPTIEMSRRVQDTISSVKALQQKIKMMTEQNITTEMTANQQGVLHNNDNLIPFGNNAQTVAPASYNISQPHAPLVHAHQEVERSELQQYAVSPQPMEHPPVRAESRGANLDVRMSSYKSRATSLLFNLKDNRKRVKSTYSPPKFKGLEIPEKSKQPLLQEPRDTVIDIPEFPDPDIQFSQVEASSRANAASHQYVNQYHTPGLPLATLNSQPATAYTGQYSEYTSSDYQTAQMQGEIVHHSGFTGLIPENYASNQLANGQNLHEDLSSFPPYKQGMIDNVQTLGGDTFKPSYTATEIQRIYSDNNQAKEYLISKANTEQHFNETVGREFTKVDRYQQLKENQHDYSNVSSQDRWGQTNSQDTENISLKAAISPWKQETTALIEKDQHAQAYQRAAARKEELSLPRDKYREENQQNKELEKTESRESFGVGTCHKKAGLVNPNISNQLPQYAPFSNDTVENPKDFGQQQPKAFKDKQVLPKSYGYNKENETKDNYLTQNYNRYADHDKTMLMQETGQRKQMPKGHEIQSLQSIEAKPQLEHNKTKMSLSDFDNASAPTIANRVEHRQFAEVKAEQAMAEHIKAQHAQAELAKAQHWAQVEQPKVESAGLILTGQTGSEKVKAEQGKAEITEHERVAKAEHIEPPEQYGEKQSDQTSEEQTKAEQTRSQKVTEKPKNITEEAGDEHMRGVQEKQVKVEQVEAERLKEEHIKTDLAKTEQASIKQAITEQARGGRIKAEQLKEEEARAKQVEREQIEAERIRTEKVKAEQAEAERRNKEQAKPKHLKEQQDEAEQEKTKVVDSIDAGQINAKQPITQISNVKEEKVKDRNPEQAKSEQTKVELAKAEQTKTEIMQERSAKLTATQQVRSEPDKVEQVKTELAKAKAELAKIKEKMRGEQKVKNAICTKEDGITKGSPLRVNINKNEEDKDQHQAKQRHQQREDSVVVQRQSVDNAIRGANDYTCLREKYGFTDTALTEGNKPAENVSSNDASDTPSVILDKVETTNNEKSKDRHSPTNRFATANTENKVDVGSFKSNQVTESHYVYSESSKEFKLSGADHLPRANSDAATNKMKDDSVEKLERCDPLKNTDVSQQADFGLAKTTPLERKPKSTEHSVGPSKDPHFTPTKALSHKERAQTKQEILTSKIKAHAEKEISAIKEKGFAKRDGFISKTSTKLLGSQGVNIRQRPPSQEVSKKQESTMSSNTTPKNHMELSGIQMEPVKSVSDPSSAAIPVKSVATTSQLVDHSQKQVPKDPMKSKDNVPTPREGKQAESYTMSTDEGLVENQKKVNESGIKSPMQSKEEVPKNKQGQQEENYEISGKQKERLKDNLNKEKEDPPQATALVKTESSKPVMTEKAKNKHETCHKDTVPSLNLVLGQNETPVVDESLQITGIMVTVRERKLSLNNGQRNTEETESNTSKIDKCHPSSGLEVSKGSKSSMDVSSKIGMNNHPETMQEISTLETRQNNVPENVKRINLQHASTSTNTKSQRETQLQEPQAEKAVPSAVTVPTKNKVPAEPLLYKQDTIARESKENSAKSIKKGEAQSNTEEKNPQRQKAHSNETFMAKAVNTGINHTNNSNKSDAETLIMHDIKPSLKEDMTTVVNPSKIISIDAKNAPLLEEKRCDSTPAKPLNKTNPSNHLTQNENIHKETHTGENNQVDDDVHIGSISIRVVPAVTQKDNLKTEGKHHVTTVPSGLVAGNEHTQVASSNHEKKVDTNKEDIKDLTPASCEKQMKDSLEDKLGVQHVWSSVKKLPDSLKISNQQNSRNITGENTQAEDGKPEKAKSGKSVDESKIQPMEGDYFQVQRIAETKNEPHNSVNIGDTSNAVLKGREPPGLVPNKTTIRNESCNEEKSVFVLDQSKIKTVESSSVSVQDEITKKKNREKEDNLASNQRDGSTERQSNKNEKTEAGQTTHIRKHTHSTQHTENQSSISARERQSSNSSHPARENTVEPEVKPKPKEKVSTIPEITALADYARLKVIASEDRANTIQEFPPNKKEGFFPLIQTHHSRRPVFTADPKDLSVKEKSLPNKTEVNSKVNKEPKPLVFPITEKEHQRTGMFKLGDKERQEKMRSDAKASEYVLDPGVKHSQHLKERDKSPTTHLKNQGSEKQVAGTDIQRVSQVVQSISSHPPPTTCSEVNRPRNTSVSQHIKRLEAYTTEDSKQTKLRKDENTENALKQNRPEKLRQERLITPHEETMAKQSFAEQEQLEEEQASRVEVDRRAEDIKIKHIIEESRASQAEEERRATQREEERRAREREAIAIQIKERREKQREAERRAEEERNRLAKQTEEKINAQKEEEMRAKQREEEQIKEKEKMLKQQEEERAAQEEQQRRAAVIEVQQKRAAQKEQQRRAAQEEQQRRAALVEEQKRRAAQEEQKRKAAQEEQQRRAAQEEQKRRAAQEEQQRRAAQEEEQRRAALIEEQKRRAAQEEQQRRAALVEEQKKRAAQEEQQRRAALIEEQQQRAALIEEQKRRAAQEEQQRRAALVEEQKKRAAQEEQQRRVAQEEKQKKAAQEEQQRRAAQEEQQRQAAQEEQRKRAAQKEQERRAALEEQQRRAALEEQQKRDAQEEQHKRSALIEEQKRRATQEEQRQAKQDEEILANIEKEKKRKQREEEKVAKISEEEKIKQAQDHQIKEHRGERQKREELMRTQRENDERRAVQIEKTIIKQRDEKQTKEKMARLLEESQAALKKEEKKVAQERMLAQRNNEIRSIKRGEEEKLAVYREKERAGQMEEQKRAAQSVDSLQYYAITSTESERKPRERQLSSPLPSQQRNNSSGFESTEDSQTRAYRPHAPASPAPSLPRSNTSSPALGTKPLMFRVKDNTNRGPFFTKSVKPRFHKNFGEDFRVGSPMGSERGEEEQETLRRGALTPLHSDTGLNRLAAIKESSTFQSASSSQDYSAPLPHHRPYSRRSIALDEDDSRSVISNMSEDVESFATSAADLADIRGLYDYDRPESACSFSSDVSRSLGRPPAVPPKSEKALRRAKRLTTRRIKKELSIAVADSPVGVEKPFQEDSSIPSSSSIEVCSSKLHAVASPHFSPPVSLAHGPTVGSSLPSSNTEHQSSQSSFYASPHATGPISLPTASPHATAPISLPVASPHATGPVSHAVAPKIVADVPSSPTLHHANHPAPVTQYQVESNYPQSYPLTQRKVLQDLGSGQYFVVDVPVEVKKKTFFDPETGKYVQLNVRESAKSTSRPQPQQTYLQPQLQPQVHVNTQQQPLTQDSPAGKPLVLYQGYHGYPQGYQTVAMNSVPNNRSSAPVTLHQDQQPVMDSHSYGYPAPEMGQNSEGHRYSPEKTPYMDTVNDTDKTHNTVYNTHGPYESFPECDTNSQLAGSSVCQNDSSAHSRYQPRDIITMGELEDFMELSDW